MSRRSGVHHMEGHLLAPMLETPAPEFPFVALLVSGGHTMLVQVEGIGRYRILGDTLDDAAGEAFDKTAKLLGLDYPGGPVLAKLAEQGHSRRFRFPRPMTDRPGLDFSFSGLKTFALTTCQAQADDDQTRADIARAFQDAVVDTMIIKCRRALQQTGINAWWWPVVSAPTGRCATGLQAMADDLGAELFYPRLEFCTDNGAMIAYAGACRLAGGAAARDWKSSVRPRWSLEDIGKRSPVSANPTLISPSVPSMRLRILERCRQNNSVPMNSMAIISDVRVSATRYKVA